MNERVPISPGIPSISISRGSGLALSQPRRKRQPQFGDKLPGRSTHTAEIVMPKTKRQIKKLYTRYYRILNALTYGEAQSLCRGLECSYSTFLMRKYQHRKPKLEEVILVVGWAKAGKPVTTNKRGRLTIAALFGGGP